MSLTLMKLPIKNYYYPLPWETEKTKGEKTELKTYLCGFAYNTVIANYPNVLSGGKYVYYSPWENDWIYIYQPISPICPYNFPQIAMYTGSTTYNCNVNILNNMIDGYACFRAWRTATNYTTDIHRSPDNDGTFWAFFGSTGITPIGNASIASLKFNSISSTIDLTQNGTGIFDGHSGSIKFKYEQPIYIYRRSRTNGKDLDYLFGTDEYKDSDGNIDDVCGCYINSSNAKIFIGNDFFKISGALDEPENMLWIGTTGAAKYLDFLNEDGSVESSQYYSHRGVDYNMDYRIDYFYRYTSSLYPSLVTGWYLTDFSKFYQTLETEKGVYKFTVNPTASNSNQTNTYTLTWVKLTDDAPDKPDISISYYGSSRKNCYSFLVNGSKDFVVNVPYTCSEVLQ